MGLSEMGGVVLKVSGIVMPCVSVWQAWCRWAYERSIERAERLERILSGFKKDEVADSYYRYIEHGESFYDNDGHDFIGDEKKIDQMLAWFSFLCYQHRRKVISNAEFSEFSYQISMVVENQQVQAYCTDLYSNEMTHEKPFVELIRYGKDHGCVRMRDLYEEFCGREDVWGKIKKWLGMGKDKVELTQSVCEDAVTSNKAFHKGVANDNRTLHLPEFERSLHRYYSDKSVVSICWCARKASELLEKSLDEMTDSMDNYARACDGIVKLDITAKLKGNLKHAIDKYRKFRNGEPLRPMTRVVLLLCLILSGSMSFADISVSDVEVFSGYPWKEVVIGYTITGTDANADIVRLTATDKSANKSYTAKELLGAKMSEGRHVLRWKAASEGVRFFSANVVFAVSVVRLGGVQLWANGPYWAECNVGAAKPEEYGYCFWWGDTVGYKRNAANNGWVSVKDGRSFSFGYDFPPTHGKDDSKLRSAGYIDSTGSLVAAHDAATQHWGAPWRMPTSAELDALISNCTTTWTTRNGVYGQLFTGIGTYASKSIFLPAAGYGWGSDLRRAGFTGGYWSSSPKSDANCQAWKLGFTSLFFYPGGRCRYDGLSVRPLRGFAQ